MLVPISLPGPFLPIRGLVLTLNLPQLLTRAQTFTQRSHSHKHTLTAIITITSFFISSTEVNSYLAHYIYFFGEVSGFWVF